MAARLITQFEMTVQDPSGGDDGWAFTVTVPPMSVVEQLDELLHDLDAKRREIGARMLSDPDVIAAGGDTLTSAAAFGDNEELQRVVMEKFGTDMLAMLTEDAPASVQRQTAALIEPYCEQPRGLVDAEDRAMTWEAVRQANEPYAVAVLHSAAQAVYDRTRGHKGQAQLKN